MTNHFLGKNKCDTNTPSVPAPSDATVFNFKTEQHIGYIKRTLGAPIMRHDVLRPTGAQIWCSSVLGPSSSGKPAGKIC